ncbi:hypothetical protein [Ascidiimonas aurantiaca]|uniref:hypothetical protein n=1 Tax=Ascidiimonas aurantiaca TaxID=1685432 RepID=UPI0030EE9335
MKTKSLFLLIILLFLTTTTFIGCSPNSVDDEPYERETFGIDKDIKRPGDQHTSC